jgi:oligopeptide transport system substrate-binding protein
MLAANRRDSTLSRSAAYRNQQSSIAYLRAYWFQIRGMAPSNCRAWQSAGNTTNYSVWTFYVRPDARWSNGDPVTASDFAFSIQRILTPELGAFFADELYSLRGAEDFNKGKTKDFTQVGVSVVDPRTLRLELIGPTPYLLSVLTHHAWFPVHPATILRFGQLGNRSTRWTQPDAFVGDGPFALKTWKANDVIETIRNPFY